MNTPTFKDLLEGATQGEWKTLPEECHRSYIRIRGTRLGARYKIANVLVPDYKDAHEREANETRANANLIARCNPEVMRVVLGALEGAKQVGEIRFRTCVLSAQVDDQIKKAIALLNGDKP